MPHSISISKVLTLAILTLGLNFVTQGQTTCSSFNYPNGPLFPSDLDRLEHSSGAHVLNVTQSGSCTYSGSARAGLATPCSVVSSSTSVSTVSDIGSVVNLRTHYVSHADRNGTTSSNGGEAKSDAESVGAVESCIGSCAVGGIGITITGNGNGGGFTVTFSGSPLWSQAEHLTTDCLAEQLPPLPTGTNCPYPEGQPPYNPENGWMWEWNTSSCTWQEVPNNTPVAIETQKGAFEFTDPSKGEYVTFDIRGDGNPQRISWPKPGAGIAWLVLDRDGDGVIKDGTELFGNFTPHSDADIPSFPAPNGFLALGWYDHVENGGNGDLIIDKRDPVWSKLRLWIDEHCYQAREAPCESRPRELHTLESEGIQSLSIVYSGSFKKDRVGNLYKFSAVVNPLSEGDTRQARQQYMMQGRDRNRESNDGRLMYDVVLKTLQP